MLTADAIEKLNLDYADSEPRDVLAVALERWPQALISFSGAEDVVLLAMASKLKERLGVITLDTGRLHPETYQFIERVRQHYPLDLELLSPDAARLQSLVRAKGLYSFYQDGHEECCGIRKVEPLRRRLATADAWISGQRRDQSPTRTEVPLFEIDRGFSTPEHQLIKVNPLANWSSAQVWNYIRLFDVPYNPLHDKGFVSIGCEPCTRPVGPNQHERAGRWWWEESTIKECGLHNRPERD